MANTKFSTSEKENARISIMEKIKAALLECGEDIDFAHKDGTHTTVLNLPIVIDGKEAWLEIPVIFKADEDFDGYELRDMKKIFDKNKIVEKERKAKDKAKRIADDKEKREAKRLAKELEKKKLAEGAE